MRKEKGIRINPGAQRNGRDIMTGNREVITGSDFKRMVTGAYSEFLLEYENINDLGRQ